MAVKVRKYKGAYWLFIDLKGHRTSKRVGPNKRAAEIAAERLQAKIDLGHCESAARRDDRWPSK